MEITTTHLIMAVLGGCMSYILYLIKKYQTKVDELESRVTRIETIISLLGDIKDEISNIKVDVAVIKNKVNNKDY